VSLPTKSIVILNLTEDRESHPHHLVCHTIKLMFVKKNCMLYYKDNKDKCDICGTSRYKDGSNKVPCKVLHYLPITDRLQRFCAHEGTTKLMRSHKGSHVARSTKMLHPCHGNAWQQFDDDSHILQKMLGM
jgi:hypothetical protein